MNRLIRTRRTLAIALLVFIVMNGTAEVALAYFWAPPGAALGVGEGDDADCPCCHNGICVMTGGKCCCVKDSPMNSEPAAPYWDSRGCATDANGRYNFFPPSIGYQMLTVRVADALTIPQADAHVEFGSLRFTLPHLEHLTPPPENPAFY